MFHKITRVSTKKLAPPTFQGFQEIALQSFNGQTIGAETSGRFFLRQVGNLSVDLGRWDEIVGKTQQQRQPQQEEEEEEIPPTNGEKIKLLSSYSSYIDSLGSSKLIDIYIYNIYIIYIYSIHIIYMHLNIYISNVSINYKIMRIYIMFG